MTPYVSKVFPVFAVSDLDRALAYYRDVLGFEIAWTWGDPAIRAGVTIGEIELHLDASGLTGAGPQGPSVIYCHMTGVDSYFERCRERGAVIPMELGVRPWGMRDFRVLDPDGNQLGFGEAV